MPAIKHQQQKLTTCLWFNNNAEQAVKFYTSVFKNSKKEKVAYYGEGAPVPKGTILTITFQIEGKEFIALNGGPLFKFTEAVSFIVNCKHKKKLTITGRNFRQAEKNQCVAGSKISSVYCGRLFPKLSVS